MGMDGGEPNGCSLDPTFAPGGCFIGFTSDATNRVGSDTNEVTDAFVRPPCIPGGLDGDERVNRGDLEVFESCLAGSGIRPDEERGKADLDVDLDVDLSAR